MGVASRWFVGLSFLFLFAAWSAAEDESKTKSPAKPADKKKSTLDDAQESTALSFAREHHPELAELLTQLNTSNRPEYERAIRELSQTSERLQRVKKATPNRYPEELEKWKLDSRIKLLAARSSMSDDPQLEAELKDAVKSRVDFRLRELTSERNRLTSRLKKLEEQIQEIEADPAQATEKDLQRVKGSIHQDPSKKNLTKDDKKKARKAARQAKKAEKAEVKADGKSKDDATPSK